MFVYPLVRRSEVRPPRRPSPTYDDGRSEPDDPEPAAPIDPQKAAIEAVRRDFEMALKSGSSRRSKKDDLELESQTDEMLAKLRMRMTEVADLDRAYNNERKPAISKIKLLPVVSEQLRKTSLHDAMLENGLLEAVRLWLEPLDDGSLPALDIQLELFNFLLKAPIHTEHLRESGMGKLVVFYTKCNRVDTRISRISEELVAKWIRPLIQRSANYKDRSIRTASSAATARPRSTLKRLMDDRREEDLSPGMAARVQVPRYTVPSYDIMPSASPLVQQNAGRKQQPEYMQRLKAHMTKNKTRAARH
ncbi:Transcription factor iws1 [Tieghemiomyces parasiticus]|uniref:Transcription factor iws1 n=1 Tax=Tieghemiomyces parasiticus TaxID=78921 RepID=A0A9W7ZRN0_9FUNG|nr:Transcription factor iws1 [Tieghemiomyces parasiticus]